MNIAAIAQRAIRAVPASLKATCVFSRVVPGTYDPIADTSTGDTTESFTVKAPMVAVGSDSLSGVAPAQLALYRDVVVAGADATFPPSPTDTSVVVNGVTWTATAVETIEPDGVTDVLYVVRMHR